MTITAQDFFEITQVIQNFFHHGDFGRVSEAAKSFAEDAEVEYVGLQVDVEHAGKSSGGRAGIEESARKVFRGLRGHVRHWASVPLLSETADGIAAESYVSVLRVGQVPHAGVVLTGVYRDQLAKNADGRWEIRKRVATLDPAPEHRGEQPYDVLVVAQDLLAREQIGVLDEAQAVHAAGERISRRESS